MYDGEDRNELAVGRHVIYRFGGYSIDAERRELRRGDETLEVQPKVLDLVVYLIRERGRVVSRPELLDGLWGDAVVIEGVLSTAIHAARSVLDDSAADPWAIKTVARRGYRFVAAVEEDGDRGLPAARAAHEDPWTADAFVGRAGCLARLDAALAAAGGGRGRVVVVTGESGIGKTRLVDELVSRAARNGTRILAAWCFEGEGSPPYWPWTQILRAALGDGSPEDVLIDMGAGAADLVNLVPALHDLRPDLPEPPRLQSGPSRFRLFESIATFLANAAKRRPILMLIDDLHSADHASLRLLGFLARELRHARILALVTVRDDEKDADPVLEETLAELARHSPGERIHLDGLSLHETGQLVESLTGREPSRTLLRTIAERSEGNPFFVKEIVNLLQTRGRLGAEPEHGTWASSVPPGVRDVILRRLHRRSEACQRVLALSAVLGREFRRDLLASLGKLASDEIADGLDEARASGFVQEHPTRVGHYRFTHGLMQETLYSDWSADERTSWHRRAAELLEALPASSPDTSPAELAHHFLQAAPAGGAEKAVDYTVRAAEHAAAVHAHDEAAKHYGRALAAFEFFSTPDDARRCELLIALGTAQLDSRRSDPSGRDSLLQAARIARELGRTDLLARAGVQLAAVAHYSGPGDSVVIELLEEALAGLGAGDEALRARVMADLAIQRFSADTLDQGASLSEEAVALARKAADPAALGETLNLQCALLSGPDHIRERIRQAEALLELAREGNDAELAISGHRWRLVSMLELGEIEASDLELEEVERSADEARDWDAQWYALTIRGTRAFVEGRLDEAERLALEAFAPNRYELTPFSVYTFGTQLLWLRREQGRLGEVASQAGADYVDSRFSALPAVRVTTALVDADQGAPENARRELDRLVAGRLADLPKDFTYLYNLAVLSELCSALGNPEAAAVLYDALRPFADRIVVLFMGAVCLGSASRYLGQLATTMGRWEQAEAHFEDAMEQNRHVRARLWIAHTQLDRAGMAHARGGPNASTNALALLDPCLVAARELGLRTLEQKARELAEWVRG